MSEELLSAMLDGECSPAEMDRLLREMESNPALKARWSRMCLVRDAMAATRVPAVAPDFCSGVMAAIARDEAPVSSNVVPLRRRAAAAAPAAAPAQRPAARAQRWQPVAGLAAAASIAAVAAVGGYRWLNQPVDGANAVAASGTTAVASSNPLLTIQPVSHSLSSPTISLGSATQARLMPVSTSSSSEPAETKWAQLDAETARQLNEFMMEHSTLRGEQGMGGALSYPRMVRSVDFHIGNESH